MLVEGKNDMIIDNDKTVLKNTLQTPLTPELMSEYGYIRQGNHGFGSDRVTYQDPLRSYIRFKECDADTNHAWSNILLKKGQRYCYVIRLELYTISSSPVYTLYTIQDLKMFQKVLEELEDFESKVEKKTLEIVKPIENLKSYDTSTRSPKSSR